MPAVVRVKRRVDEEPLTSFVLNGKKRRRVGEDGDGAPAAGINNEGTDFSQLGAVGGVRTDEISTVLKFAGTIQEQDDTATTQLARLTKDAAKELVQQKTQSRKATNHTERARQEMRQSLHENRFRVVNCMRTTLNDVDVGIGAGDSTASSTKEVTIVDIEKQNVNNATTAAAASSTMPDVVATAAAVAQQQQPSQSSDSDTGYVYDLYLPENEQHVDLMDDNYLSVRPFDDLIYEDRFNDAEDDDYDSEDSNQENCAGNEYPDEEDNVMDEDDDDEDDDESVETREMRQAVEKFVFNDSDDSEKYYENDGSSDDDDVNPYQDPYVHTLDADGEHFVDDVDYCDVDRYGMAYAKYKARILKKLKAENADPDDDNDDDDDDFDDANDGEKSDAEEHYQSASENENNSG